MEKGGTLLSTGFTLQSPNTYQKYPKSNMKDFPKGRTILGLSEKHDLAHSG